MGLARDLARMRPNSSGQILSAGIADDAINAAKIASGAVTGPKIAANAVVVQSQAAYQTSAWSTSSTSYVDFLSVTITPTKATNRIVLYGSVFGGSSEHTQVRVTRNGVEIPDSTFYDGYSSKTLVNSGIIQSIANNGQYGGAFSFIDSPGSTGAVTYKIQVAGKFGSVVLGRNWSGNTGYALGQNFLQAVEMAG